MREKGFAHLIILILVLLVALTVYIFIYKPWQKNLPAPAQKSIQKSPNQQQELPKTNPFETKVNPFKDIKTNPFN